MAFESRIGVLRQGGSGEWCLATVAAGGEGGHTTINKQSSTMDNDKLAVDNKRGNATIELR